jgi:hypothetical protein
MWRRHNELSIYRFKHRRDSVFAVAALDHEPSPKEMKKKSAYDMQAVELPLKNKSVLILSKSQAVAFDRLSIVLFLKKTTLETCQS